MGMSPAAVAAERNTMNTKILKLLEQNARLTNAQIATALGMDEREVADSISKMEADGIIRAYKGVINREMVDDSAVSAIIELKVVPKAGFGFDEVAKSIAAYDEVESVSLMSGACDLRVIVTGRTFHEVSSFVANELAFIDGVTSTSTQFIMKRYKELGTTLFVSDERDAISL